MSCGTDASKTQKSAIAIAIFIFIVIVTVIAVVNIIVIATVIVIIAIVAVIYFVILMYYLSESSHEKWDENIYPNVHSFVRIFYILQQMAMHEIHLKEVTNCSWLLSKWCFCQNWDRASKVLMTPSAGRREVALMLIGPTFNLPLIVPGHKRCCR